VGAAGTVLTPLRLSVTVLPRRLQKMGVLWHLVAAVEFFHQPVSQWRLLAGPRREGEHHRQRVLPILLGSKEQLTG